MRSIFKLPVGLAGQHGYSLHGWLFLGSPAHIAAADAVLLSQGNHLSIETMQLVMASVAATFVGLEGPIEIWKIAPDAAERTK